MKGWASLASQAHCWLGCPCVASRVCHSQEDCTVGGVVKVSRSSMCHRSPPSLDRAANRVEEGVPLQARRFPARGGLAKSPSKCAQALHGVLAKIRQTGRSCRKYVPQLRPILKEGLLDLIAAAGGWRQATSAQASVHPQARGETARGETLPEPKGPLLSTPRGGAADDMSQNVPLSLSPSPNHGGRSNPPGFKPTR